MSVRMAGRREEDRPANCIISLQERKMLFDREVGARKKLENTLSPLELKILQPTLKKMDMILNETLDNPLELTEDVKKMLTDLENYYKEGDYLYQKYKDQKKDIPKISDTGVSRFYLMKRYVIPTIVLWLHDIRKSMDVLTNPFEYQFIPVDVVKESLTALQFAEPNLDRSILTAWLSLANTLMYKVGNMCTSKHTYDVVVKFNTYYENFKKALNKHINTATRTAEVARKRRDKGEKTGVRLAIEKWIQSLDRGRLLRLLEVKADSIRAGCRNVCDSSLYNMLCNLALTEGLCYGPARAGGVSRMTRRQFRY